MASIDKTYTESYSDYMEFKKWADNQVVTFFDGTSVCIGGWVWDYEETDFQNGEIPIMNTPVWLDAYLLQNCKIDFVLDRMKSVHCEDFVNNSKDINFSEIPKGWKKGRKIKIKHKLGRTKFSVHNKPYGGKKYWWLQSDDDIGFNSYTKTWSSEEFFYPHNTNTMYVRSVKSLIRYLRKQNLPYGVSFTLIGRYVGEEYTVYIGK